MERLRAEKIYCQPHSRLALVYFRASANGRYTSPKPSARSSSWQDLDFFQILSEWLGDGLWKHGDTILLPLAVTHQDLAISKVDIYNAEADTLHQA
jgi:hypothetical protein